jgi:hypothetical protein
MFSTSAIVTPSMHSCEIWERKSCWRRGPLSPGDRYVKAPIDFYHVPTGVVFTLRWRNEQEYLLGRAAVLRDPRF